MIAVLGALAVGLSLGVLGSGGSILTVPVLVFLLDQPEKVAIAGSLAIVGSIAAAGAIPNAMRGQVVWRSAALFGLPGMAGTFLGASLARWIPGAAQLLLFAAVMLVAAWRMCCGEPQPADHPRANTGRVVVAGAGVGLLSGLVGVGGGFLIVPALVLLTGLPMRLAIGTSLVVIAMNSFVGFGKYLFVLEGQALALDWRIIGTFAVIGAVGSLIGGRIGARLPQATLRKAFAAFLVLMAAVIALETTSRLRPDEAVPAVVTATAADR
jgi:uncharacterized protein